MTAIHPWMSENEIYKSFFPLYQVQIKILNLGTKLSYGAVILAEVGADQFGSKVVHSN